MHLEATKTYIERRRIGASDSVGESILNFHQLRFVQVGAVDGRARTVRSFN
jgi:hypothetical protein